MKKFITTSVVLLLISLLFTSCNNINRDSDRFNPGDIFYTDSENASKPQNPVDTGIDSENDSDSDINIVPNYVTVTFVTECESIIDSMKFEIGQNYTLPVIEQFNYTFLGWYFNNELVALDGKWSIDCDAIELVAKWQKNNENIYKITYDFNGGNNGGKEFPTYYDSALDERININSPTRNEYKFIGWEIDNTVTYSYRIDKDTIGDISLKALWHKYDYTYQDDSGLQYILKEDKTLSVVGYVGGIKDIFIPSSYNDYVITEIGPYAFCGFEDKLSTVQSSGFFRCNISETVTKISIGAFAGCDDLKVQFYGNEVELETWLENLIIEERNDHVLDVINGKRPAIGWKPYYKPSN